MNTAAKLSLATLLAAALAACGGSSSSGPTGPGGGGTANLSLKGAITAQTATTVTVNGITVSTSAVHHPQQRRHPKKGRDVHARLRQKPSVLFFQPLLQGFQGFFEDTAEQKPPHFGDSLTGVPQESSYQGGVPPMVGADLRGQAAQQRDQRMAFGKEAFPLLVDPLLGEQMVHFSHRRGETPQRKGKGSPVL